MVNDILETDADKLFNLVKKEKKIRSVEAAKKLDISTEKIISLAEILEEDNLIELHYPPIGEPLFIYKDAATKKIEKEKKEEKKHKPRSGQLKLLGIVLSAVFLLVSMSYKSNPEIFDRFSTLSFSEYYLDMNTILIIATVFTVIIILILFMALEAKKKRMKEGKANEGKKGKEEDRKGRGKPEKKSGKSGWRFFGRKFKKEKNSGNPKEKSGKKKQKS